MIDVKYPCCLCPLYHKQSGIYHILASSYLIAIVEFIRLKFQKTTIPRLKKYRVMLLDTPDKHSIITLLLCE